MSRKKQQWEWEGGTEFPSWYRYAKGDKTIGGVQKDAHLEEAIWKSVKTQALPFVPSNISSSLTKLLMFDMLFLAVRYFRWIIWNAALSPLLNSIIIGDVTSVLTKKGRQKPPLFYSSFNPNPP